MLAWALAVYWQSHEALVQARDATNVVSSLAKLANINSYGFGNLCIVNKPSRVMLHRSLTF